jgi:hypothetical protein
MHYHVRPARRVLDNAICSAAPCQVVEGESVLIHSGVGGFDIAAIHTAKLMGAEVRN